MRDNKAKHALERGETVFGSMVSGWSSSAIAQILANAGFDFVFIDTEHADFNMETVSAIIRMARQVGIAPFVRVANHEYSSISRPLDAGAQGIMVPHVETRGQVEAIVAAAKYPPEGRRGCSVSTGHTDFNSVDLPAFLEHANAQTLVIIQIECEAAVESIEGLVSVPGVDVAMIGPNDLSVSLGVPGDIEGRTVVTAIDRVIEACAKYGVAVGIHSGNMELLRFWMRKGMKMLAYSTDVAMLRNAAIEAVKTLREASGE